MSWTKQQNDAIYAKNSSIIVSAAAGSGKTAVLTERLVKLISDPESRVRADRIVVVTFTNDAADELKKRLNSKLRNLISERRGDPYLLKQQSLLQSAQISTINSFCFEFLRNNINDQMGITSGFRVLDEKDDLIIRSQAMDELLDLYTQNNYKKISFLYDCFCLNDLNPLIDTIKIFDNFLSSIALRDKWLDKAISEYHKPFEQSIYYSSLFDSMKKKLLAAIRIAKTNLNMVKDIFPDMTIKQAVINLKQAQDDLGIVETILSLIEQHRFPNDNEKKIATNFKNIANIRGVKVYNKSLREIYSQRRKKIKSILCGVINGFESSKNDFNESRVVVELLVEIIRKYCELIWKIKIRKNAINFDDGERLVLDLLADFDENGNIIQSEIAKCTAEYYDIIMIDEYQDSNNKEDLIFKLISKNFRNDVHGKPMYGDNVFIVGDIKQSIYGFRLANPQNFQEIMNNSEPYTKESDCKNKSIIFNKNFRSSPEVINFINFIFTEIMTTECGGIDYNEDEMLYFGAKQYLTPFDGNRKTHITFLNTNLIENKNNEFKLEVNVTVERIEKMFRDGYPVTLKNGKTRPCCLSDFCILVRNNNEINQYESALEKRGISAKSCEEKRYNVKSSEIAILIDLLTVISNPLLDVPLAAVLTSPMYMFTVSELAILKINGKTDSLYSLLCRTVEGEFVDINIQLSARCGYFLKSLEQFRLDSITMTIDELISSIYNTTDFISVIHFFKDVKKKSANLITLIQHARNYETYAETDGSGGLSGFLRYIKRICESGGYEHSRVSTSSNDYVSILTDHKSKGLEFPFVFIAETSHRFKFDSHDVMCSDDGRIGFILHDKNILRKYRTFQQIILTEEMKNNVRSEEMRLLYVAMTRAKQQLFINLDCGKKYIKKVVELWNSSVINGNDISELVSEASDTARWFWLCLMHHGEFHDIANLLQIDKPTTTFLAQPHKKNENLFEFELHEGVENTFEIADTITCKSEADDTLVKKLEKIIFHNYDRSLSETTAKLSVTQIIRKLCEDEEFDFHFKRPKFISVSNQFTGAELGTAIHTFLQYCDFDNSIDNVDAKIQRMKSLGFITDAQSHYINQNKIKAFFHSKLYKRITNAVSFEREKKFMIAYDDLKLHSSLFDKLHNLGSMIKGIIDLVFEEKDGIVIVDYKSDIGMNAESLVDKYRNQLKIYRAALELITEKFVKELLIYSIELEKEIKVN